MSFYRPEIDGLRSIAVISVILFHLGYAKNGYLGVDVFFVISGFLITSIIYKETLTDRFSLQNFYLRRIRRIIPLVLFINVVALIIGILVMLPNDLKDLAQSVVATNFFSNNILELYLTKDYWDISNEFKPLMHTWSLGIEEQFYVFYPLIFIFFSNKRIIYILPFISLLTIISFSFYLFSSNDNAKFYLLHFRFFELSIGGIGAILVRKNLIRFAFIPLALVFLVLILFSGFALFEELNLILVLILSLALLVVNSNNNFFINTILQNKLFVGIGKISFSLYMWHQLIFAFGRYFVLENSNLLSSIIMVVLVFVLSIATYYFVERPFRNKVRIGNNGLFIILGTALILTTGIGLYLYFKSGVIRDVAELGIKKELSYTNTEIDYNENVHKLFKGKYDFKEEKIMVLVIGNSFARDWVNVLQESKYKDSIDIIYVYGPGPYTTNVLNFNNIHQLWGKANYVFISNIEKIEYQSLIEKYRFDPKKLYIIGVKNFGLSNGRFYNMRNDEKYCQQFTEMRDGFIEKNEFYKKIYGIKYINIIELIGDKDSKMPVFGNDCKFISQDGVHLTQSGAKFLAQEIFDKGKFILMSSSE